MTGLVPLLLGAGILSLAMGALWLVQRRTGDAGIVDVGWTLGVGLLAVLQAAMGEGWPARRAAVGAAAALWSLRLALHLLRRSRAKGEDGRYADLRVRLGPGADRFFLAFFQAQALLAVMVAAPFVLACADPFPAFRLHEFAALGLFAAALAGEALADAQLSTWRRDPANAGRTCRRGLWGVSRHPNYFFEWLMWMAWALSSAGAPLGWAAWSAPALMLLLILKVTGIPPTEARALRSRGDDYRAYQRSVSAFFPWFPRKEAA
jgi:steroid 5-alpha reductase family enzyme